MPDDGRCVKRFINLGQPFLNLGSRLFVQKQGWFRRSTCAVKTKGLAIGKDGCA